MCIHEYKCDIWVGTVVLVVVVVVIVVIVVVVVVYYKYIRCIWDVYTHANNNHYYTTTWMVYICISV